MKISAVMRNTKAAHIDFTPFVGVIESNPKFLPSNLDMILERNGNFIVAEWKRHGEKISLGQQKVLQALAVVPRFVVLVITGDTDDGLRVSRVDRVTVDGGLEFVCDSADALLERLRNWYATSTRFQRQKGKSSD